MRGEIRFLRRGKVVKLPDVSPTLTLLDYLRLTERATGTKEGCAEGDCGACTVVLRRLRGERLVYEPVNACILFAGQADGCEIITVEDLARDGTLHPVQQAMVDHARLAMRLLHAGLRDGAVRALSPRRRRAGRPRSASTTGSPAISAAAPAIGRSSMRRLRACADARERLVLGRGAGRAARACAS